MSQQARSQVGRGGAGAKERRMVPPAEPRSYYGQPVIKQPVWKAEVPIYFFTGGLAGASAGLAFAARLSGRNTLARVALGNAFLGIAVSPPLLIADLGVPRRFLNMLRVFKVTSPMSVGSWILNIEGVLVTVAVAHEYARLFPRPLARVAEAGAALFGMPLATYTAALVADTAVPAWHEARIDLPFAFAGGSAMAAGGLAALRAPSEGGPARRLAIIGAAMEMLAMERAKRFLGKAGEPYSKGTAGRFERATMACAGGGGALLLAAELQRSRKLGVIGSILAILGSMFGRWTVFKAGKQSAAAPEYTIEPQLERQDAGHMAHSR